jgi:DNA-binding MarR family transcriptional regulator
MGPVNTLGYLLSHTASIMHRQSDQVLQERLGIGMSQFKLLMMLGRRPHSQQRELAEALGQTEASVSRQIKLLVGRGMLVIDINPKNRREHRTTPTAKGVKIAQAAMEVLAEFHGPTFAQLSEKEQEQLVATLRKLHAHVCQSGKPFACDQPFGV